MTLHTASRFPAQPGWSRCRSWMLTPPPSRAVAALARVSVADIRVTWEHAIEVFRDASLIEYCRRARLAFGPAAFDAAPELVQGALVSLVYNRGASMIGPARLEMRHIRDVCLPAGDAACVAAQIRAMTRLWRGSSIEAGMYRRRYAEATLAVSRRQRSRRRGAHT